LSTALYDVAPLRGSVGVMNKNLRAGRGLMGGLLVLFGLIWTMQGLGVLQSSSPMTGQTLWAVIGPIVAILGVVLVAQSVRARRPR
jgi:hypothetical protein